MKIPTILTAALFLAATARAGETRTFKGHDGKSDEDVTITLRFDDANSVASFDSETGSGVRRDIPGDAIYRCGTVTQSRGYSRAPWGSHPDDAGIFNQAAKCWTEKKLRAARLDMLLETQSRLTAKGRKRIDDMIEKMRREGDKFD